MVYSDNVFENIYKTIEAQLKDTDGNTFTYSDSPEEANINTNQFTIILDGINYTTKTTLLYNYTVIFVISNMNSHKAINDTVIHITKNLIKILSLNASDIRAMLNYTDTKTLVADSDKLMINFNIKVYDVIK